MHQAPAMLGIDSLKAVVEEAIVVGFDNLFFTHLDPWKNACLEEIQQLQKQISDLQAQVEGGLNQVNK